MEKNIMSECECNICKPRNRWALVLTCPADGRIVSVIGGFNEQDEAFDFASSDKQCNSDYHYFVTQYFDKEDEDR